MMRLHELDWAGLRRGLLLPARPLDRHVDGMPTTEEGPDQPQRVEPDVTVAGTAAVTRG